MERKGGGITESSSHKQSLVGAQPVWQMEHNKIPENYPSLLHDSKTNLMKKLFTYQSGTLSQRQEKNQS